MQFLQESDVQLEKPLNRMESSWSVGKRLNTCVLLAWFPTDDPFETVSFIPHLFVFEIDERCGFERNSRHLEAINHCVSEQRLRKFDCSNEFRKLCNRTLTLSSLGSPCRSMNLLKLIGPRLPTRSLEPLSSLVRSLETSPPDPLNLSNFLNFFSIFSEERYTLPLRVTRTQAVPRFKDSSYCPKPCSCGDTHWIPDCAYSVTEKRSKEWKADSAKQNKLNDALQNGRRKAWVDKTLQQSKDRETNNTSDLEGKSSCDYEYIHKCYRYLSKGKSNPNWRYGSVYLCSNSIFSKGLQSTKFLDCR